MSGVEATPPEDQNYDVWHDPAEGALLWPRRASSTSPPRRGSRPCCRWPRPAPSRPSCSTPEVDFIDSTALGAIMHASTEAEAVGKRMLVVAIDGPVRRLLEITNLTGRFRVYPSRDDALAAVSA